MELIRKYQRSNAALLCWIASTSGLHEETHLMVTATVRSALLSREEIERGTHTKHALPDCGVVLVKAAGEKCFFNKTSDLHQVTGRSRRRDAAKTYESKRQAQKRLADLIMRTGTVGDA